MPEILIRVRNKHAEAEVKDIVCDNTDYTLRFDFDGDWEPGAKLVYFALAGVGTLAPATTADDVCVLPRIHLTDGVGRQLAVGVQQGTVKTTTCANLFCYPSAESELLCAILDDPYADMTWLEWVNANMAQAAENVTVAEAVLTQAREAAETAEQNAESAAIDAAAARLSAQTIMFPVFWVDEGGHVVISYAERLGSTTFRLDDAGYLHVEV